MDALVAFQIRLLSARTTFQALCKQSEGHWSTPPLATPPDTSEGQQESSNSGQMGHPEGFLLYLQRMWNRLMHSSTILDQLMPEDPSTEVQPIISDPLSF